MNHPFFQLLMRWLVLAVGVALAAHIVPGISYDDGATLILVVLVLSFFNAILKPVLLLFTLPFIVMTMGLGVVVINALLFLFAGRIVEGFHIASFWSALGGALIVSTTNFVLSRVLARTKRPPSPPRGREPAKRDDVIDI